MPLIAGWLLFYFQIAFVDGLKVNRFVGERPQKHETDVNQDDRDVFHNATVKLHVEEWLPNTSHPNSSSKHKLAVPSTQFCGCNGSSCSVNAAQVKSSFSDVLILIFGSSLDIRAIGFFCNAAWGVDPNSIINMAPFSYLAHCTVGGFTIAYVFHPGASPPPYSDNYNPGILGTTRDILSKSHADLVAKFGREPTAIVVEASLWDVSNWWAKLGRPPYPYSVTLSYAYLQQWCNKDVPQLLADVATVYPRSNIAFRTAPPIIPGYDSSGQNPLIIEKMVDCLDYHTDALGRIYGIFGAIDYHDFVVQMMQSLGAAGSTLYSDSLHPGAQLSMLYINNVLNYVKMQLSGR